MPDPVSGLLLSGVGFGAGVGVGVGVGAGFEPALISPYGALQMRKWLCSLSVAVPPEFIFPSACDCCSVPDTGMRSVAVQHHPVMFMIQCRYNLAKAHSVQICAASSVAAGPGI